MPSSVSNIQACDRNVITGLFWLLRKPQALPVEVPRKKALASSIERSELLIAMS